MGHIIFCYSALYFIALVLSVHGQYAQSPCPGIFTYQSDGVNVYGLIRLSPTGRPVSNLHVRANFTVAARLTTTYVGQIETIGNDQVLQKYNRGTPLSYRVYFPVTSPLPRLTAIVANGNTICYGAPDLPALNQYVTTISLEHMLYLKPGATDIFQYKPIPNQGSTSFNYVGPIGDSTQVFTINEIDNKGTWSSNYYPLDQLIPWNNTRPTVPVYEQPVTRPTRTPAKPRPEVYYPEATEAYRPPSPLPPSPSPLPPPTQPPPPRPTPPQPTPPQTTTTQPPPSPPPTTHPTSPPIVEALPSIPPRLPAFPTQVECGVISGGNERIPLIYHGHTYPRGDLPWLVAVYKRREGSLTFICAGTLISERHVITAAHCMHQKSKISTIKDMVVKIGVYNLEDWGDDISITRTLQAAAIHESYNATTLENDILVFTLERTVKFNTYIRPACLWTGNTDLSRVVGASGVVAGWGASEVGPVGQGEPRMVRIPIVSTSACRASRPEFHKLTSSKTLCAGDRNGSGPCLGDSGGGLYILDNGRWRLRGVVSLSLRPQNGDTTCNLNEYIVFTDTAQYLKWIRKILSQNYYDT